jgi:hypothetical protein
MWTSRKKNWQTENRKSSTPYRDETLNFPHLRRVLARLSAERQIFDARLLLNDLSARGARVFSSIPLNPGTEVSITLNDPRPISVRAIVTERRAPLREGHIVSDRSYAHRLTLQFDFSSEDERTAMAEFVAELAQAHGIRPTAAIGDVEFPGAFV